MWLTTSTRRTTSSRAAAKVLAVAVIVGVAVSGCTSSDAPGRATGSAPSTSASPQVANPVVAVAVEGDKVSYSTPVSLSVTNGTFSSVQVSAAEGGQALEGDVAADKASWRSQEPPRPAATYRVSAVVTDAAGQVRTETTTFTVAAVPDDRRISFTVTPDDGKTVGIGQPVVVRFATPVTQRAALEKVMLVEGVAPTGAPVVGGWHWLSDSEVHWRPKDFWTPGTKVTLTMKIAGVQASATRVGRKDYTETFTIGASHVTRVDAAAHKIRVYRDNKLVNTWPAGTGRKGLETYSGTYVVLGKDPVIQMDSCSARITCDKKDPDYYDEKEYWATRVTASGTFLHAAGWDNQLGRANVSHGCIHLGDDDAKNFFSNAVIGDVVVVTNSGRGPAERIATQDPGLYDWNLSWAAWQAGSALT